MEFEELESNLHALKQLYGLLRNDGNGFPNSAFNSTLDDKSRLLLKKLLDGAVESVFKIHSEVLGTQVESSLADCSERAQKTSDSWMQLPANETSDVLQVCGNDRSSMEYTGLKTECSFREPHNKGMFSMQPSPSLTSSGNDNRHKFCRVCQRQIVRNPTEESAACDSRNEATALSQLQNFQPDSFLCGEKKDILTSPSQFPVWSISSKDNEQIGQIRLTDALQTGPAHESIEEATPSHLSKEASDVIKQIEVRIQDLRRWPENLETNGSCAAVHRCGATQLELSDKVHDILLKAEQASDVVMAKPPMVTRIECKNSEHFTKGINDSQKEMHGWYKGASPLQYLPSMPKHSSVETELPKLTANTPLRSLPPKKTMRSPVSSQMSERLNDLAPHMQIDKISPYEENRRQNYMTDRAFAQTVKSKEGELEPDLLTSSDGLKPIHLHNYNFFLDNDKIPSRIPASVTSLTQQMKEMDLRQDQSILEDNVMKSGACQTPLQYRTHKDHSRNGNTWALDSRHKVNQFLRSQSKIRLTGETKKWQPSRHHRADPYGDKKIVQHQHESDSASLSSESSNWNSQGTSLSYSGSEEYYLPQQIHRRNYINSPSSSENDMYNPSDESEDRYKGVSSSDNEVYSWQSSDDRKRNSLLSSASSSQAFYSDDSDTDRSSPDKHPGFQLPWHPRDFSASSASTKKIRPKGGYASSKRSNRSKKIGRWKKLKDKLSIIFHHHHHHHHHHYNQQHTDDDDSEEEEDLSNHKNKEIHGKLLSRQQSVVNSHSVRPEADEKEAFENMGRAIIHSRDARRQQKPANALMGGLFKHIRHSKGTKPSGKHIKHLKEGQHDRNKTPAKLNWLKILHRHRKGKKFGIGYGKR
ncbi:OLC1v1021266C1 [Oldenlandia corymbosa var. corymbosa]|nr:OLC1v1021266C1 [Oldenlandia corymbosa var. corymbosa]